LLQQASNLQQAIFDTAEYVVQRHKIDGGGGDASHKTPNDNPETDHTRLLPWRTVRISLVITGQCAYGPSQGDAQHWAQA
jgi:hypothetical protein